MRKWLRSFEIMARASQIQDDEWKHDLLLHYAGPSVQQLYETLPELPGADRRGPRPNVEQYVPNMTRFEEAVARLNAFFLPKENTTYERHLLRQMKQNAGESIDTFTIRLRIQADRCGFGDKMEENIKDQIIQNCKSATLRRDLLKRGDAGLNEILRVAKIFETVAQQEKSFAGIPELKPVTEEVNKVNTKQAFGKRSQPNEPGRSECGRCGYMGYAAQDEKCPAKGKSCNKCGGRDHFARKCRKRQFQRQSRNRTETDHSQPDKATKPNEAKDESVKTENTIKQVTSNDDYVFNVTTGDDGSQTQCEIGGVAVTAIIDSGSKYNLLSETTWERLKSKAVVVLNQKKETGKVFRAYGGHELPQLGMFTSEILVNGQRELADFYVIKGNGKILLGRDTAIQLGVLKIGATINEVDSNGKIETMGKIKNVIIDIPIRTDAKPIVQPYRRIPVALEKAVDARIDELLAQGIVERVNEPSKWVSPVVAVPKGDDVRICVDMRRANDAVERENHPLPTIEDFLPHLGKAKMFSRLDVKNAFHQVEISRESREITTFITRKGLFRYTRLMFGISCAPELFQKLMEQILGGCDGCLNFIDDIIVFGEDKREHDHRLAKVQEALKENEVGLNEEKCVYGANKIKFLGHTLSGDGITADSDKLEAIRNFREPHSGEEVRSFLGLVNYVGKFIPDLATLTEPLRLLMKQNQKFVWGQEQKKAFDQLKAHMLDPTTLGYFDVEDRTQLIADASPVGLGAVLIQMNERGPRIISYASKSLSDVEKRYAQTEKEALALVWATERFHFYLYGRTFELITDHKPLETIFGPKSKPCLRIERWVLRLQAYKGKVIYRPGKTNIADPLSRLAITRKCDSKSFDELAEHYVNWVVTNSAPVAIKLAEIERQSAVDEVIQAVKCGIKIFAAELCFAGEILMRGTRIVMPESLRDRTLELAHEGHPGMTLMKQRLRAKVWWPKLDVQVEKFVKNCRGCMLVAAPAAPVPMKRRELPSEPWQHLAMDFLGPLPSGHNLLVLVDYYSRYIEVDVMTNIDSKETIKRISAVFARFGLPISLTADNGRQLISDEFRSFCEENNIQLISTIPYWPQMNGEVERQNRSILKRLIISQSAKSDWRQDLNKYLLMYRSTPHSTTQKTPAEMLFGRNIRDKVPGIYRPMEIDEETADKDKKKKEKERQYADERRNAKESNIQTGDSVLIKRMKKANKLSSNFDPEVHKVVRVQGGDVTVVSMESGAEYRRHISHLQKIISAGPAAAAINPGNNISDGANKKTDGTASKPMDTAAETNKRVSDEISQRRITRSTKRPAHLNDFVP